MSEAESDNAKKYTLVYYMPDDSDPDGPPFKYRTYYLADAIEGAWLNHKAGGSAVSIVKDERIIFNNEDLLTVFRRMSELIPLRPERPLREIAEQIIRESGKA